MNNSLSFFYKRAMTLCLVFLGLHGCAQKPLSLEQLKSIKVMGVALAFDDTLFGSYTGVNLSGVVVNSMVEVALGEHGAYEKASDYSSQISSHPLNHDWLPSSTIKVQLQEQLPGIQLTFMEPRRPDVHIKTEAKVRESFKKQVISEAKEKKLSHVLIIRGLRFTNMQTTGDLHGGIGVYCRGAFGIQSKQIAYISFEISLYDIDREKLIYEDSLLLSPMRDANIKRLDTGCKNFGPEMLAETSIRDKDIFQNLLRSGIQRFIYKSRLHSASR